MKRKKRLRILFFLALIIFLGGYLLLKFSWLTLYSIDEMKYNARIVDSSISPPPNFLNVWDRLYPDSRHNGMNNQLLSELTAEIAKTKFRDCKCDEIGYLAWNNDNYNFKFNLDKGIGKYRRFGYGLQYYTTPAKCFDFWLNNGIIWNGRYLKNLNELSTITLNKNIESLNQNEVIQLIAYRQLSYNRANDSTVFSETVNKLTANLKE